jgi:hypothetical protein
MRVVWKETHTLESPWFHTTLTPTRQQGLDLVYWDYYHTEAAAYERMISKHAAALVDRKPAAGEGGSKNSTQRGRELVVATGGWTWSRFWAALPMAFETTGAAMQVR